jgi:hypothetical protein
MDDIRQIRELDTPEGHLRFMKAEWRALAAFAWSRHRTEGRGAIVINLKRAKACGQQLQVPTYYVAEGGEKLARRGGWPGAEVKEAVAGYDPEQEVVFLFLRVDGDIFHYVASDDPPPPEA